MTTSDKIPVNVFSDHLFWSYNREAKLPASLITEHVISYGEIEDLIRLSKTLSPSVIKQVIISKDLNDKRANFLLKILLDNEQK